MGNAGSRQFADALHHVSQDPSGTIPSDRLLDAKFLVATSIFLEEIQLCWDHLPCSVTDIVKRTLSSRINAEQEPEAWVQRQIGGEPAPDLAIHLYDHLTQENQSDPPQLSNAKRNVWLVAFSQLRETYESSWGRGALVNHILNKKQHEDKKNCGRDCSALAKAGERLQSILAHVGGSGALICGLSIPWTALTKTKGFNNVSPEAISDSLNRENMERCGTQVDELLTAYKTQARAWIDRQKSPPSRKRKRKDPPARIANSEQAPIPLTMVDDGLQHVDDTIRLPNQGHSEISAYRPLASPAGERHPSPARGSGDPYGSFAAPTLQLINPPTLVTSDEELVGSSPELPCMKPVSDAVILVEANRSYRGVPVNTEQQHTAYPIVPSCEYSGPRQWFINGAIGGEQNSTPYIYESGPQRPLAVQNVVPDTALSVIYAMNGNISGLRELFSQGRAQPGDQSATRGFSLVRWALYGGLNQYATVQYLLQEGAPVDNESYDHVNDFIYRKKCNPEEEVALKPIWSDRNRDWFDDQHFPRIHRILLAEDPNFRVLLVDELRRHPNAILEKDAKGRTALDWATARAQLKVMELLIRGKSNVNSMDESGRTTVLHAVDSHNHAALEMVLKAGANPNPEIREGWHRSSPLTSASFGGLTEMVDLLLEHGATINTRNPEGRAALHTAIIRNKHEILRIFIKKFDGDCLRELELLPVIAQHADEKAMSILATSSQFLQVFYHDYDDSIRDFLEQREDYSSELHAAFDGLLIAASDRRSST